MAEYNAAFFGAHTNYFLVARELFGEEKALQLMTNVMEKSLTPAFEAFGAKHGGGVDEFIRVVGSRDETVGLKVSFEKAENGFYYCFLTYPFPLLKGKVDAEKLDATFIEFKKNYFLGSEWAWKITKHCFNGDDVTEYYFTKK